VDSIKQILFTQLLSLCNCKQICQMNDVKFFECGNSLMLWIGDFEVVDIHCRENQTFSTQEFQNIAVDKKMVLVNIQF